MEKVCLRAVPVGMLLFKTASVAARNAILEECSFSNADIKEGQVSVVWFRRELVVELQNKFFSGEGEELTWDDLWGAVDETLFGDENERACFKGGGGFFTERWSLSSVLVRMTVDLHLVNLSSRATWQAVSGLSPVIMTT